MSLLIKALEQAAKDRDSANGERSAPPRPSSTAATAGAPEPTLEPPPPPRAARTSLDVSSSPRANAASAESATAKSRSPGSLTLDSSVSPTKAAASAAALAQIDAHQQRARAAAVMQASSQSGNLAVAYLRGNPVVAFGALAAVFGVGFGIYVYLQVTQPGLFVRQAAKSQSVTPLPAVRETTASPTQTAASSAVAAPSNAQPSVADAPLASPPDAVSAGTVASASPARTPVSAASVIGAPRATDSATETPMERPAAARGEQSVTRAAVEPRKASAAPTHADRPQARERIAVTATSAQPRINPMLSQAYAALQSGNTDEARALYSKLTQSEPLNVDALLGLAYIAAQDARNDEAATLYLRILQINPRHAAAQAALIGSMGRTDPLASETRLKQLIAREPTGFLHFVLGNLYADQSLWPQAQQAYFQAHHLEPDNPDYAYNLAVGLDHLRQSKLALTYYRRAEQLAVSRGRANFDLTHARERISSLSAQLQ